MEKTCTQCSETKNLSEYYKDSRSKKPWNYCKACASDRRKQRYRDNPEREKSAMKSYHLRKNFGISEEQYKYLLESQGGVCLICKSPDSKMRGARFAVDHDHRCCPGQKTCGNCIRGLLCHPCNRLLGQAGDDPDTLIKAAGYLLSYNFSKK